MLSMKAKYALRALALLGRQAGPLPAHRIAEEARVPEKFLEAILVDLRRAGYVASKRGLQGGPLAPIRCASLTAYRPCDDCPDPAQCAVRHLMTDVRNAIAGVLDRRSLRDHMNFDLSDSLAA